LEISDVRSKTQLGNSRKNHPKLRRRVSPRRAPTFAETELKERPRATGLPLFDLAVRS
jgi:hypothetical protein